MKPRMGQERGQDLVEYALILPLFLFLVISVIEISVLFFSYVTVSNAAREGARVAATVASDSCNQACIDALAREAALALTTGLPNDSIQVNISHPDSFAVRVEVRYRADLLTRMVVDALGGQGFLMLSSTSTMRREG